MVFQEKPKSHDFVENLVGRIRSAVDLASYNSSIYDDAVFEGIRINERDRFRSREISGNLYQVVDETEGRTYLLNREQMDEVQAALKDKHKKMKTEKKNPSE